MSNYNQVKDSYTNKKLKLPNCYIYLYHTDEYFLIPQYPDTISDTMDSSFSSQNALSRTSPVFSYNNSGPRSVQVSFKLHRDLMNEINTTGSNVKFNQGNDIIYEIGDDYIDVLIKKLQAVALPRYDASSKLVTPPQVAVRFGEDVFIKGVVASGGVTVAYDLPILSNNKYARVSISFTVSETQPYDADSIGKLGNFRGLTSGLEAKIADINKRK